MPTAAALESAAARLRVEAHRIESAVASYLEPAVARLPELWVGPAADQLETELIEHRGVLWVVAAELRATAGRLEWRATEIRAAETLPTPELEGVSGAF